MKRLLLAACAVAAMTAQATANDVRIETGFQLGETRVLGFTQSSRGLFIRAEGHYDMGLSFDANLVSGRVGSGAGGTIDFEGAGISLGWRVPGYGIGPAVSWQYASTGGMSDDTVSLGLIGRHAIAGGTILSYSAFSDIDNFGDVFQVTAGGEMTVAPGTTILGDIGRAQAPGSHFNSLSLGVRYNLVGNMDLTGAATYSRGRVAGFRTEDRGMRVGLNFRF